MGPVRHIDTYTPIYIIYYKYIYVKDKIINCGSDFYADYYMTGEALGSGETVV